MSPPRTQDASATVIAAVMSGLAPLIEELGGNARSIMSAAGLGSAETAPPDARIPLHRFCTAMALGARATGCDSFGLRFGAGFTPNRLGFWGYIGLSSRTLGEALGAMAEYMPYHQRKTTCFVERHGRSCTIGYRVEESDLPGRRHDAELSLGMFRNLIRASLGQDWVPQEVHFEHARPAYWREHKEIFGSEIRFGQGANALILPLEVLDRPMPGADPILLALMQASLKKAAAEDVLPVSLIDRAMAEISALLPHTVPTLEQVARRLDLPAWKLRRQLGLAKTTFRAVMEDTRKNAALEHLAADDLSISDIAEDLGYAETSAFTRAFCRWYGVSPRQWRNGKRARQRGEGSPASFGYCQKNFS